MCTPGQIKLEANNTRQTSWGYCKYMHMYIHAYVYTYLLQHTHLMCIHTRIPWNICIYDVHTHTCTLEYVQVEANGTLLTPLGYTHIYTHIYIYITRIMCIHA